VAFSAGPLNPPPMRFYAEPQFEVTPNFESLRRAQMEHVPARNSG